MGGVTNKDKRFPPQSSLIKYPPRIVIIIVITPAIKHTAIEIPHFPFKDSWASFII